MQKKCFGHYVQGHHMCIAKFEFTHLYEPYKITFNFCKYHFTKTNFDPNKEQLNSNNYFKNIN